MHMGRHEHDLARGADLACPAGSGWLAGYSDRDMLASPEHRIAHPSPTRPYEYGSMLT